MASSLNSLGALIGGIAYGGYARKVGIISSPYYSAIVLTSKIERFV